MALNLPESAKEVISRSKVDVQRELNQSDPFVKNHWLLAIVTANSNRVFDFYLQLKQAILALFPDTTYGQYLTRWAAIFGKSLNPATKASGNVVATGTSGHTIPAGTTFVITSATYTSTFLSTISENEISISSLVTSGSTATATTTEDHGLGNNIPVSILGSNQSEYNVANTEITIISPNEFTYQIQGTPVSPATGTILATYTSASIPVESDEFGLDKNLDAGTNLRLQSPIAGVNSQVSVDFNTLGGATDIETEDSLRERLLERIRNPLAQFNAFNIVDKAREIPGVTRVFVKGSGTVLNGTISVTSITRSGNVATVTAPTHGLGSGSEVTISGATEPEYNGTFPLIVEDDNVFYYMVSGSPATPATGTITLESVVPLGKVNVYFTTDNSESLIPSGSEVITVRNKILEILPANTSEDNLLVAAPSAVSVDFVFSDLSPTSSGMRSAIIANLEQFFRESTTVGVNIDQDAYRAAIFNSVDPDTGLSIKSFSLSSPTSDITILQGEIGTLGNITF